MPKCCPENYVLSTEPALHGLSCKKADGVSLPEVPLLNITNYAGKNQMYLYTSFPSCEGFSNQNDKDWEYTVHLEDTFVLKTGDFFEYTLYLYTNQIVLDKENKTKNAELIYSNDSSSMVGTSQEKMT